MVAATMGVVITGVDSLINRLAVITLAKTPVAILPTVLVMITPVTITTTIPHPINGIAIPAVTTIIATSNGD